MDALVGWLLGLSGLATCLLALACTVLINDRRTYYPLLKLIFGTVAGVTGATAAASLWGTEGAPSLRVWGSGALLAAMAWSAWFVRRRNRFPAYILVDLRGVPLEIDPDQIEVSAVATLSLIRHGAATPELVERAREAVAEYDRLTAWKHELARQAAARSGKRTKEQGAMTIDSRPDTYRHIQHVQRLVGRVVRDLLGRAERHDQSKLISPEVEAYDELTPRLAGLTYGSDEYRATLREMKPAIAHHYAANSHHPEHYPNGIVGMNLLDVVEMLCDWKAASLRHNNGDFRKSIEINQERFGYSDELKAIFLNTLPLLEDE